MNVGLGLKQKLVKVAAPVAGFWSMRQKPWSSSETHQLVWRNSRPRGWVTPETSRIARRAANTVGESCGGLSLPIWLLTQGGGLRVKSQGSGTMVALDL